VVPTPQTAAQPQAVKEIASLAGGTVNASKKALKALVAAAAVAIPVGLAIPAQATTSNGCTVTPVMPYANGDINANGVKLVDYDVNVSCTASALSKTVYVTMQRWEQDTPGDDDIIGTSTWSHTFSASGGSTQWKVTGTLASFDGGLDNYGEIYQGTHFAVRSNGVTSPYTSYQFTGARSIHQ
jgi:hypothetical protein